MINSKQKANYLNQEDTHMTKKAIIIPVLLSMSLLTACGDESERSASYSSYTNYADVSSAEEYVA